MRKFTYIELQKCAEREAALRRNVYKRHGKDQPADLREIAMMEEIAEHFKVLAQPEEVGDEWVSHR